MISYVRVYAQSIENVHEGKADIAIKVLPPVEAAPSSRVFRLHSPWCVYLDGTDANDAGGLPLPDGVRQ